jgi:hypothetical protein
LYYTLPLSFSLLPAANELGARQFFASSLKKGTPKSVENIGAKEESAAMNVEQEVQTEVSPITDKAGVVATVTVVEVTWSERTFTRLVNAYNLDGLQRCSVMAVGSLRCHCEMLLRQLIVTNHQTSTGRAASHNQLPNRNRCHCWRLLRQLTAKLLSRF